MGPGSQKCSIYVSCLYSKKALKLRTPGTQWNGLDCLSIQVLLQLLAGEGQLVREHICQG